MWSAFYTTFLVSAEKNQEAMEEAKVIINTLKHHFVDQYNSENWTDTKSFKSRIMKSIGIKGYANLVLDKGFMGTWSRTSLLLMLAIYYGINQNEALRIGNWLFDRYLNKGKVKSFMTLQPR